MTTTAVLSGASITDEIDELVARLNERYDEMVEAGFEPAPVQHYLTEPAQQFVAVRAVRGGALPQNQATAVALRGALDSLHNSPLAPIR